MKERYVEPEPILSPGSQRAIRAFLAEAHAALRLIQDIVPPDDRGMFSFGGLQEVESTVMAIERFLASPRHRDEG
jgi:hypothetical protein